VYTTNMAFATLVSLLAFTRITGQTKH
jgi:hypothetical protein